MLRTLLLVLVLAAVGFSKPPVGKPAPGFSLAGLNSKENVSLSDFQGKVLLLDFWASWCMPCRRLMPMLGGLKARNPQLEIVAISVDEDRGKALTFLRGVEPGLKAAHDAEHKVADAYALEGMPTCVIIDKQGRMRFRHDGYSAGDLEKAEREIKLLLAEP